MKLISLILAIFILSGCAATGKNFSTLEPLSSSEATVYIYRPSKFFQGGTWPTVFIDGEERFTLKNEGYVFIDLSPGEHEIKIGKSHFFANWMFSDVNRKLNVESNKRYYLRLDLNFENIHSIGNAMSISGSIRLVDVPEQQALPDLKSLKLSM